MHHGAARQAWNIAGCLMALVANVNRNPRKHRPFRPTDFMPPAFAREAKRAAGGMTGAQLRGLKGYFQKKA